MSIPIKTLKMTLDEVGATRVALEREIARCDPRAPGLHSLKSAMLVVDHVLGIAHDQDDQETGGSNDR